MVRRLYLLTGLAIIAVILNHAAGWGFTAMFWWVNRYTSLTPPNYDQIGSISYYFLVILKQLTTFSVPVFLFVSGFFVAYASRSVDNQSKFIAKRIQNLLIPYLFWSCLLFIVDNSQSAQYGPIDYIWGLLIGGASPVYYYIPVICQLYILSPWIVSLAKRRWKLLLIISMIVHFGALSLHYLNILYDIPVISTWLFPGWVLFFSIGVISGFKVEQFKKILLRIKFPVLLFLFIFTILALLEPEAIYRVTGKDFRGGPELLSTQLYAIAFILAFLAYEKSPIPFSKFINLLSGKTYGIYLAHPMALLLTAKFFYHFMPGILANEFVFIPILTIIGLGLPLLLMIEWVRLPARKYYSYFFG
jgi:surface polysaccharide O-acyltransferase-like enzyme